MCTKELGLNQGFFFFLKRNFNQQTKARVHVIKEKEKKVAYIMN